MAESKIKLMSTVAIVMAGPIAQEIRDEVKISPRRSASLWGNPFRDKQSAVRGKPGQDCL